VDRLGLGLGSGPHVVGRLGSGPRVMRRLESRVWVSASFQIFALAAGGCHRWEGNCPAGEMSGKYDRGEMSERGNVLHSSVCRSTAKWSNLLKYS